MNALKTPAAKAMIAFVVVSVALVVALWPRGDGPTAPVSTTGAAASSTQGISDEPVTTEMMSKARADAALPPCPTGTGPAAPGAVLAGVQAQCLADGATIDVGAATAGRPTVINLWAVWCQPCRRELPLFDRLYAQAGDQLNVLGVHAYDGARKEYAILTFLAEVGVHLPVIADVDGTVAKALGAPRVFPSTILVRADGTVAEILPTVFDSYEELTGVVRDELGVDLNGVGR
ncbi:TlpA disulfide reductase family protein [Gordonia sp. VNK21]|uniref:TlpA disulfide reductase family protein n=1 Tax=Gordonia sp. VNK21 TaxID=3382483 RepID=UPI0038D50431